LLKGSALTDDITVPDGHYPDRILNNAIEEAIWGNNDLAVGTVRKLG
jgi:hypothetical protein